MQGDDKLLKDPNYFARKKSQEMWGRYMFESKNIARWILTCNFFFGVLPGILFFVSNVRISQEEDKKITNILPDFNRAVNWFGILFVLFPMFISVFQMFKFYRLISLRMTRTFFVGQLVGFVFYMCAFSKSFLEKFHWFPKKTSFIGLVIILIILVMVFIFLPYLFLFSEVVSYKIPKTQKQLLWQTKIRSNRCLQNTYQKL
jgi:hypothetical protein